jgi:hypothetical protein
MQRQQNIPTQTSRIQEFCKRHHNSRGGLNLQAWFLLALKQTVNAELHCYQHDWESNQETGAFVWPKSRCDIG